MSASFASWPPHEAKSRQSPRTGDRARLAAGSGGAVAQSHGGKWCRCGEATLLAVSGGRIVVRARHSKPTGGAPQSPTARRPGYEPVTGGSAYPAYLGLCASARRHPPDPARPRPARLYPPRPAPLVNAGHGRSRTGESSGHDRGICHSHAGFGLDREERTTGLEPATFGLGSQRSTS